MTLDELIAARSGLSIVRKPCASGNWRPGRAAKVQAIVLHLMAGTLVGTDHWFGTERPSFPSSAHYGIGKDGTVHQYVDVKDTAYHAGRVMNPTWHPPAEGNANAFSIGIEHEGFPSDVPTPELYRSSAALVAAICYVFGIPCDRAHICGHHELFSGKVCPGPNFNIDGVVSSAAWKVMEAQNAIYNAI